MLIHQQKNDISACIFERNLISDDYKMKCFVNQ